MAGWVAGWLGGWLRKAGNKAKAQQSWGLGFTELGKNLLTLSLISRAGAINKFVQCKVMARKFLIGFVNLYSRFSACYFEINLIQF